VGRRSGFASGHRQSIDFDFFSEVEFDDAQKQKMLAESRG
jgi:hypothetical protein